MEANAPDDAAQPTRGRLKLHIRTIDKKWGFNQLAEQEPDLGLSADISKFNAQLPNLLSSSTASTWTQRQIIVKLQMFNALYVGKRARDKHVR